ncbi:hypothetical protein Peur_000302 [Populus x canadensis]
MEARNGVEREGRCIKEEGDMGYAWLPVCHKQRPIFCFRLAVAGGVRGAKHTLSFSICVYACVRAFDHSSAKLLCITSMLLHVLLIFIFPCS